MKIKNMNSLKYYIGIFIFFHIMLSIPINVYSNDYWDKLDGPMKFTIDISDYTVSRDEMIDSILDPMLKNNWSIDGAKNNSISAIYKLRQKIRVTFSDDIIIIEEIPTKHEMMEVWLRSLSKHIEQNIKSKHFIRILKSYEQ